MNFEVNISGCLVPFRNCTKNKTSTINFTHWGEICQKYFYECNNNSDRENSTLINITHWVEICEKYFNECNNDSDRENTTLSATINRNLPAYVLVIIILIAFSSLLTNGFVCLVYTFSLEIRTAKHYFIVNLGVADIFIALVGIPFYLTEYMDWDDRTLCQIGAMIDVMCSTNSIMSFVLISVERYTAVKWPLRYQTIVTRNRCLAGLISVWIYSLLVMLASRIPIGKFHMNHCSFFTKEYLIATSFTSFLFPLFVMVLVYGWIFKVAKRHSRKINYTLKSKLDRVRREYKAAKTFSIIIGAFLICYLPLFVYIWLFHVRNEKVPFIELFYIVNILRYLNGFINPLIYVGINKEFRRSAFKILNKIVPHRKPKKKETANDISQTLEDVAGSRSGTDFLEMKNM
ncbi:beta-2 adrenergic receptor-like [Xenia sp. Carnegie-2017]|uniref:beta-2 adrenergic receptor-like n=1 Tax=Xenia sp. Carnegie-2017 TaxID=2897299 RepID=UPI001F039E0A|nr:beta-2 adrenergic receptor-like [Xenia sp. Carnegie-2017]